MPTDREIDQFLRHFQVPGRSRRYVLGLFEPSITVASQQVRAVNLVKALFQRRSLRSEQRLVVIGAGAGGLTVAAAAAERGAAVTILERNPEPLSLFRFNHTRWLFPYRYEWPTPGWDSEDAGLEVLSWKAGQVRDVVRQICTGWNEFRERLRIDEQYGIEQVKVADNDRGLPLGVTWDARGNPRRTDAHVVVYAVGFGKEASAPGGSSTYWDNDNIDRPGDRANPTRYLLSGNGDGAAVDALRIRLNFEQRDFFEDFFTQDDLTAVEDQVREIEKQVKAQLANDRYQIRRGGKRGSWAWLTERYVHLLGARGIDEKVRNKIREGTEVVINGRTEGVLSPTTFPVNRLLLSRFFVDNRAWGMHYVQGELDLPTNIAQNYDVPGAHPEGKSFHQILLRRGPARPQPLEEHFGEVHALCVDEPALAAGDDSRNRYFFNDASPYPSSERETEDLALAVEETDNVVAAMGCLLRACLRHESELEVALDTALGKARWSELRRKAGTEFRSWAGEQFRSGEQLLLGAFIRSHAPAATLAITARAMVEALDLLYGARLLDIFTFSRELRGFVGAELSRMEILPLEVFPLPHRATAIRERAKKNSDTWNAARTHNLRLGSIRFGRTILELQQYADLALEDDGLLGVVVPAHARDLVWTIDDRRLIRVEPKDMTSFSAAVAQLLEHAIQREARVLVFPELVCGPAVVDDIFRIVATHRRGAHPLVVAVGSHHYREAAPNFFRRHRSVVILAGSMCQQGKVVPGQYVTPDGHCDEEVVAGEPVVVYAGRGGSLTVALGSDLAELAKHLDWLSPSLVLVPASAVPNSNHLRQQALDLAKATCATVVVGHLNVGEPGAEAWFESAGRPMRHAEGTPPILFLTEPPTMHVSSFPPPPGE